MSPLGIVAAVLESMSSVTCAHCMARFGLAPAREASTLTLDRDGRWFELEPGARVDISRRRVLRRLLVALVARHEAAPGEELETVDLLAVGWPGERVMPDAAGRRVRTAIWELRRLGLGRLVTTKGFGYALDPGARVVWSETSFARRDSLPSSC